MARAQSFSYGKVLIALDVNSTGVFSEPCALNDKSVTMTKETQSSNEPDCDDPDAAGWLNRDVVSRSMSITGNGLMAVQSKETWREAWELDTSIPARIWLGDTAGTNGGYYSGSVHLTELSFGAARGGRVTCAVKIDSDGEMTWVAAS